MIYKVKRAAKSVGLVLLACVASSCFIAGIIVVTYQLSFIQFVIAVVVALLGGFSYLVYCYRRDMDEVYKRNEFAEKGTTDAD